LTTQVETCSDGGPKTTAEFDFTNNLGQALESNVSRDDPIERNKLSFTSPSIEELASSFRTVTNPGDSEFARST
jgi:hypothetical protein